MSREYRVGIAQINCTVGDLKGNCEKIAAAVKEAERSEVDLLCFPELAVTGYPPEDLLLKPKFIADNIKALKKVAASVGNTVAVIGFVDGKGSRIYNAAAVVHMGKIHGVYRKVLLPNYGVFDEKRYFDHGKEAVVFRFGDLCFGVNICEDIWFAEGPTRYQAAKGADLIVNINASPYHAGKIRLREKTVKQRVKEASVAVAYANLVGGQDELVFDGQSFVVDCSEKVIARAPAFREDLLLVDIPVGDYEERENRPGGELSTDSEGIVLLTPVVPAKKRVPVETKKERHLDQVREVYEALVLGLSDYIRKNGFEKVVIGLSGGVDSALVAAIAVDALGKENVIGVFMPSRYTSGESERDASDLARNLDIVMHSVPIDGIYKSYMASFAGLFRDRAPDITEENIQARIRGNTLMALSNKFGWVVLTTGNKSEMSVGYATLYGDMAGGFALIKDVPKTLVYKLCAYRNTISPAVPVNILVKEPTAELKPDQKDSDTLPRYETLDPVLKAYVEEDKSKDMIIAAGFDSSTVERVLGMVDNSEYKRRQSPPGIKITPRAFGKDRRMPITNKYRG